MSVGHTSSFDLKSADLPLLSLVLRSAQMEALKQDLTGRYGDVPDFFDHDPLVIDLAAVAEDQHAFSKTSDFVSLVQLLQSHKLAPVAVKGGSTEQTDAARKAGLVEAKEAVERSPSRPETVVQQVVHELVREVPAAAVPTMVVDRPLRSGQKVYAKGADLILLAMVNPGAEVVADGHIHAYAPLRGKAMAGARGRTDARIFSLCLEAELVSIAGIYRTSETPFPDKVWGQTAQIWLDGERLLMQTLKV